MGRSLVVARPPAALVAGALIAGLLVLGARAAPASDVQPEPTFHAANTITLAPSGPGASAQGNLFSIGNVRLRGRCAIPKNEPGVGASFFVVNQETVPVILVHPESSQVLVPGETEVIAIHGLVQGEPRGGLAVFAIVNDRGVSASGIAVGSGDPSTRRCTFTAQATG